MTILITSEEILITSPAVEESQELHSDLWELWETVFSGDVLVIATTFIIPWEGMAYKTAEHSEWQICLQGAEGLPSSYP